MGERRKNLVTKTVGGQGLMEKDSANALSTGGYGRVFVGKSSGEKVAVKRMNRTYLKAMKRELLTPFAVPAGPFVIGERRKSPVTKTVGDQGLIEKDRANPLGTGGYGKVFVGKFSGEKVAVKRMDRKHATAMKRKMFTTFRVSAPLFTKNSPAWQTVGDQGLIEIDRANPLGTGGYGKVFVGKFSGEKVAVKRMDRKHATAMKREMDVLRDTRHANVLKYIFRDEDVEFHFIVLELCSGTMKNFIAGKFDDHARLPPVNEIFRQCASGLAHLHSIGVLHRDIKPSNLLFRKYVTTYRVKISDFGISKILDTDKTSTIVSITAPPEYMPYEVISNLRFRPESDIFSMGIVFYEVLTRGKHPFGERQLDNVVNIRDRKLPSLPEELRGYKSLIENMLSHKRTDRGTATSLESRLANWDLDYADLITAVPKRRIIASEDSDKEE